MNEDVTCREIVEIVTDYLEDALTPEEREAVELHLVMCDGCVDYLDQMREVIRITGQLTEESLPPELEDAVIRAFRGLKRE